MLRQWVIFGIFGRLCAFAAILLTNACGSDGADDKASNGRDVWESDSSEHVAHVSQAVLGSEKTIAANSSYEYSEPYMFTTFSTVNSRWEAVAPFVNLGITSLWQYSCSTDYSAWSQRNISTSSQGPDPSGIDRSHNSKRAVVATMIDGGNGLRMWESSGACATSPSWTSHDIVTTTNHSFDYPHAVYRPTTDQVYVAFIQDDGFGHWLNVGKLDSTLTSMTVYTSTCSNLTGQVGEVNVARDSNDDLHLVFTAFSSNTVRHEIFQTVSNSFNCLNNTIATFTWPAGTCSTCTGTSTYEGLESNCLKSGHVPSIAIDPGVTPNPIVVTFATPGSGSCSNKDEMRIYRSVNAGYSWDYRLVTGCASSIQPRAVSRSANVFHILSSYVPSGDNRLFTADWKSSDGGVSWSGAYMYYRPAWRPAGGCWWGDFTGAAFDVGHARMVYDWGTIPTGGSRYQIHGATNDP